MTVPALLPLTGGRFGSDTWHGLGRTGGRFQRNMQIKGAERAYRIRVGSYRVVYDVYDNDNFVLILQVARRSETTYRQ